MKNPTIEELEVLNVLKDLVAQNATEKGFRDVLTEGLTPEQANGPIGNLIRAASYTANLHGEVSEFWEAFRKGHLNDLCDKAPEMEALGLPGLTCAEEEIADALIRSLDQADAYKVNVAKAVSVKFAFNRSRARLHGNKKA